jgi:hypothetical protein
MLYWHAIACREIFLNTIVRTCAKRFSASSSLVNALPLLRFLTSSIQFNSIFEIHANLISFSFSTLIAMGRLHSNGKGISASAIPYSRTPPAWLKTTPEQVVDQICKLAKKGATPSQIGVVLRDSHGIAQVKVVTGTYNRAHTISDCQCDANSFPR